MTSLWPWLAVAGLGALHGLNPATGWMFAAAWGVHSRDRRQALRALMPIAAGHAAAVALVAAAVALGLGLDGVVLQVLAGGLLVVVVMLHRPGRTAGCARASAGHAGLALWSFMVSTVHGAGLMLVPALIPLCISDGPARQITASGSLLPALAAVAVHTTAMLVVTGAMALAACRGFARFRAEPVAAAPRAEADAATPDPAAPMQIRSAPDPGRLRWPTRPARAARISGFSRSRSSG